MAILTTPHIVKKEQKQLLYWSPGLAWSLIPLAFSIFTGFGSSPSWVSNVRWIGFLLLAIYGFSSIVLRGKWNLNQFDYIAFAVFSVIILVSIANSEFLGIAKATSCLLVYFYLTWGVGSLVHSFDEAIIVTEKFFLVATFLLVIGVTGNLLGLIPPNAGGYAGILGNPNGISAMAVLFLPLSVWFLLKKPRKPLLRYIPIVTVSMTVLLSEARSVWIGITAFLIYSIVCLYRYKKKPVTTLVGLIFLTLSSLIIVYILISNTPAFLKTWESLVYELTASPTKTPGITSYRTNLLWPLYLKEINNSIPSLLFGHGWGSEELFLIKMRLVDPVLDATNVGTAHNAYIGLTYQIGLIGSLLTFGSLWWLVLKNIKNSAKVVNQRQFLFQLGVTGAIVIALCTAMFETGVYNMGAAHAVPTWFSVYMAVKSQNVQG